MIILTAGHTGPNTGAQCATTQFDEGAENIWLRDRIAEILTNKYGLIVLIDNDTASLQTLTREITEYRLQSTDYRLQRTDDRLQRTKTYSLFPIPCSLFFTSCSSLLKIHQRRKHLSH